MSRYSDCPASSMKRALLLTVALLAATACGPTTLVSVKPLPGVATVRRAKPVKSGKLVVEHDSASKSLWIVALRKHEVKEVDVEQMEVVRRKGVYTPLEDTAELVQTAFGYTLGIPLMLVLESDSKPYMCPYDDPAPSGWDAASCWLPFTTHFAMFSYEKRTLQVRPVQTRSFDIYVPVDGAKVRADCGAGRWQRRTNATGEARISLEGVDASECLVGIRGGGDFSFPLWGTERETYAFGK